ncbi:MAG: 3'(2'),5'-bisphosphate nucleotidase [Planctomycetota bacterium]
MTDYAKLAEVARDATRLASRVCREVQSNLDEIRAMTKDDRSPVTVADLASQAVIAQQLADRLGGPDAIKLVGEEDAAALREEGHSHHLEAALAAARGVWPEATAEALLDAIDLGNHDASGGSYWTLDPIDGTKGFLRGQQYAVSLGFIERGEPVVGSLACPNLPRDFSKPLDAPDAHGSLYTVIKGDGVEESACDGPEVAPTETIKRLDHAEGESVSVCGSVEKAHSSHSDTDRILEWLAGQGVPTAEPARLDSQAKYAVVGRGQADAYLRLPTRKGYVERIWDHAAGALVATEAGCFVTDIAGHPLDFGHGAGLEKNRGVVCAPPRLHGLLMKAIETLGIGQD